MLRDYGGVKADWVIVTVSEKIRAEDELISNLNARIEMATTTAELVQISSEADKSDLHWADSGTIIEKCLKRFKDCIGE